MNKQYIKKTLSSSKTSTFFGLQTKSLVFLGFIAAVLLFAAGFEIYSINRISRVSSVITEREMPLTIVINEALIAMLSGKVAFDKTLQINNISETYVFDEQQDIFNASVVRFNTFMAAIMWGSETTAFLKSDDGSNYLEWKRLRLDDVVVVLPPTGEEQTFSGVAGIYFGGFVNNALRAITLHKESLLLKETGDKSGSIEAEILSQEYSNSSLKFSNLVIGQLSQIVKLSNTAIVSSVFNIESIQKLVFRNILLVFFIGVAGSLIVSFIFIQYTIVSPLQSLTRVARKISMGDFTLRSNIKNNDEIGLLASTFNDMTDHLAGYPLKLSKEVELQTEKLTKVNIRLEKTLKEQDLGSKLLVRKDLELSEVNASLQKLLKEQDMSVKLIMARDADLTKANESLKSLDSSKSEFVSIVAHQMRTPLSAIKWSLQMLLDKDLGSLTKKQKDMIMKGYRSNERMIQLINEMLDVDHIEGGKFRYTFASVQIEDLIESVLRELSPASLKRNVTLVFKRHQALCPKILADFVKLRAVLQNLIENAIKYTNDGGTVTVSAKKEKIYLEISIQDTGIGIPIEQQDKLFSKFFRATNAIRMQPDGSGLGLFIVKTIIKDHGGQMWFESEENKGSTFHFTIPILSDSK